MVAASDTYTELLDALVEGDARPLRQWLGEHLAPAPGAGVETDLRLLDGLVFWNAEEHDDAARQRVLDGVERTLSAAALVPGATPLLLFYLKYQCDQAWEVAWDVDLILAVLQHARRYGADLVAAGQLADPEPTRLALDQLAVLVSEMGTLNAASCASLAEWARLAAETAALAGRVADAAETADASASAAYVAVDTREDETYYLAVSRAALAVHDHFAYGGSDLDGAVRTLRLAEESFPDACSRSELRSHRYNLEVLAEAAEQPWIRLEHAKVVYLYPFGLYQESRAGRADPGPDVATRDGATFAERLVAVARRTAQQWTVAGWSVADHPQAVVEQDLLLDDTWKGDDPLGRQYRGMAVRLPDLEFADVDRVNVEPVLLQVELRLSELGNHYLRVECQLSGATPPQVYAAMTRAAPEFGDLVQLGTPLQPAVDARPTQLWSRLSDFAVDVVRDVTGQLAEHSGLAVRRSGRPGMYHVMLSVERGSLVSPVGGEPVPVAIALDAATAVGAQTLVHPVRNGISSLAEWLRYPVEIDTLPKVDAPGFIGDLLLRTCNTTLMVLPGTPDYGVNMVLEAAEFVATLEGMFAGWQDQIADHYDQVMVQLAAMIERLERHDAAPDPTGVDPAEYERVTRELGEMQARLEAQQLRLHQFVMASRLSLMFVTAPSLVMSPVARSTIDQLLVAAKFDALRSDFEGMIDNVLGDRIGALVDASVRRQRERNDARARAQQERDAAAASAERELQQRRERATRHWQDVLSIATATVGISGLMQIIQAGYQVQRLSAAGLVAVVVVLAVLVGWGLHHFQRDTVSGSRGRRKRTTDSVGGTRK
ncbi:hypothetical protein BDK92_4696 [Micromonospora pisi]|uniref:Uncharacterized protein n=1 Tax=Micromonospora pisi TaxID=589240 RepID=A0A495JMU1_9ACTN|nr:hypothetical protein [Micromonospora pisi]RKR90326.1 hypothetical protein BDK92_4696 [Micromonospora pisi]